ncbi:hypothetical protein [Arthrobacter cavernae]|uniref:Uncharacterized protein n=1 Tax=Arthrobacter cavernae TaxID=2817681 RepID=A0A939KJ29_9MICC|nr:hypothetical protein [Arthrobacter cavernae]MBO1267269.1 hypothetical protein [Arthrobacter cavernae]
MRSHVARASQNSDTSWGFLEPGTTVHMAPGWLGRWVIAEPITKVCTVINL